MVMRPQVEHVVFLVGRSLRVGLGEISRLHAPEIDGDAMQLSLAA